MPHTGVALPRHGARGKLSVVRPRDAAQQQYVERALVAQEDFYRATAGDLRQVPPCSCCWDGVAADATVHAPTGRMLCDVGWASHGCRHLYLEEMLYLSEARALAVYLVPPPPKAPAQAAAATTPSMSVQSCATRQTSCWCSV